MGAVTLRDGKRVAVGTAAAFDKLAAAFKKKFKLTLHVRSGLRTWQEQYDLYLKYKRGGTYALHPDAPQAYHCETNPHGGKSLDVYDSGSDNGVTVAGNARSNWLRANASKYGFTARGYQFGEPWHIELIGDPYEVPALASGSSSSISSSKEIRVKTYHKEDKTARKSGRTVKPGQHFYLHTKTGAPTSNATNVVGGVGPYSITAHVYATGTPGDIVELQLLWDDTKSKGSNSEHYAERLTVGKDGYIRASVEFKRAVALGYAVYARLTAAHANKGNVKVTVLDVDAYLFVDA